MGQTSSCCRPSSLPQLQLEDSLPNQLKLDSHSTPVEPFVEPNQQVLKTLQEGLNYFQTKKQKQLKVQSQQLWQTGTRIDNGGVVYCRGGKDMKPLGNVIIYFPNKEVYQGIVEDNRPTYGVFVFRRGCYYAGQINNFNAQGKGIFKNTDTGYTYEGAWSKSLPHGQGTEIYSNGDRYEGAMVYGVKFGNGTYSFSNGNIYEGSFYNNKSDGYGELTYSSGNKYEGQWNLGLFHGKGKFVWANGEIYEGDYQQGKRHGHGKYTFKNGSFYQGSWVNGYQSGQGFLRDKFDEIKGRWEEGQLIV